MSFRTAFITKDYRCIRWPEWFTEKWAKKIGYRPDGRGALHSAVETHPDTWAELPADIQKVIDWDTFGQKFIMVWLHKCGSISRCQIERNRIVWSEPTRWEVTEQITHDSCMGCADVY